MADKAETKSLSDSTNQLSKAAHKFSLSVLAAVIVGQLVYWTLIITSDIESLVRRLPDDSFYYLKLAENFVKTGRWTFDGHTVTSGFHVLYAYALAGLYAIFYPSAEGFLRLALVLALVLTVSLDVYLLACLRHFKSVHLNLGALSLVSSHLFFINAYALVEWPMMFFISIVFLNTSYKALVSAEAGSRRTAALFFLGLAGSLARSDFGFTPAALSAATLVVYRANWSRCAPPFAGLAGAVMGVIAVFGHHYFFSGDILQSSAKLKAHWSQVEGISGQLFRSLVFDSFGGIFYSVVFIGIFVGAVLIVARRFSLSDPSDNKKAPAVFFLFSCFTVVGYTIFYSFSSTAGQPWYNVHILIPIVVIGGASLGVIERASPKLLLALSVLISVSAVYKEAGFLIRMPSMWNHQSCMYKAQAMLESSDGRRYGAWNTGIVGYFSKASVINIDGLVNNEIYPYILEDRLFTYLAKRNISFLLDFENMFTDSVIRRRGGYYNFDLENFLKPTALDFRGCGRLWSRLMLLEIRYPTIPLGAVMRFNSKDLMFSGWRKNTGNRKIIAKKISDIIFRVPTGAEVEGSLFLELETSEKRRIQITLNELVLGSPLLLVGAQTITLNFSPAVVRRDSPNVLQIELLESGDTRFKERKPASMVFVSLKIQ